MNHLLFWIALESITGFWKKTSWISFYPPHFYDLGNHVIRLMDWLFVVTNHLECWDESLDTIRDQIITVRFIQLMTKLINCSIMDRPRCGPIITLYGSSLYREYHEQIIPETWTHFDAKIFSQYTHEWYDKLN